jgi:hypothetical protein
MSHISPSDIIKAEAPAAPPLEGLRRYIPLAVWVIVLLVILIIPLKIISLGYLPGDDALRHAGKAVSGKPWSDILVLGPPFRDQNFVWHAFLREIYLWSHCDTDQLVTFAVILLFVIGVCSPLPWLKRPETWLIALAVFTVVAGEPGRLMIGRPLMLTMTVLLTILCAWQFRGPGPPRWWTFAGISLLLALCTLVHGVWYLWALPVAAFFLAGEFRWGIGVGIAWLTGSFLGAMVTGHPIDALRYAFEIGVRTMGMYKNVGHAMSMELQPFGGDIIAVLLMGGLLLLRRANGLDASPWKSSPVFWLVCMCWVLGFNARRFWVDWGWPALLVLLTAELQALLQARMAVDSLKRLALTGIVAVMTYLAITSDYGGRWTQNLTTAYLTQDNPDLQGWLPDKGGIFYTADMTIFFQTFYKNPQADWKYILGYEPALMPDKDFEVYRTVHWNYGDVKAYQPWVDKMRPPDRLVIRGSGDGTPSIPELEWKYGVSGIWIGRLPQTNGVPTVKSK